MRVLVVGSGPAGTRHVRTLLALGQEAAVARREGTDARATAAELGVPTFAGLAEAAAWEPEAVVVANAPSEHLAAARWAVERGCAVLVEKPLAASLDGVDRLIDDARQAGVHLAVGHNLRFHPGLQAVKGGIESGKVGRLLFARLEVGSFLPDWRPEEDYRRGSAARRALGGGSLLTLVHELDLALWIAGDAELVAGVRAKVSGLEVDADDIAELILRHASGALTSVHMDLLDRAYNRRSRWAGEEATIEWTWQGPVRLLHGDRVETLWEDPAFDLGQTYVSELQAFLRSESPPGDALANARRALGIAAAVQEL